MELTWIEDFLTLARTRHFTQAAAIRCTTQPALSRRLQRLEEWLGCSLIERGKRPVALTPEGEAFLNRAARLREDMLDARRALTVLASHYEKAEKLYTTNTLAIGFLPGWLAQTKLQHYSLVVASITGCIEALRAGRATLALVPLLHNKDDLAGFETNSIGHDRLVLCARADILPQIKGDRSDLSGPLLMFAPGTGFGAAVTSCLAAQGIRLTAAPLCESASAEALAGQVRAGLGAAWIPESLMTSDILRCPFPAFFDVPYEIGLLKNKAASRLDD